MQLKFRVFLRTFIMGPSPDALNAETLFPHKHYEVKIRLEGEDEVLFTDEVPEDEGHFRRVYSIVFYLREVKEDEPKLGELVLEPSGRLRLLKILTRLANRVLRSIRNYGYVYHVQEIHPDFSNADYYLRMLNVQVSEDGEQWSNVGGESTLAETFMFGTFSDEAESVIKVTRWPDIEEAIQDDLDPPPEQEFFANTIEQLRRRNYRMALIESILCLEIVMSQYLSSYLTLGKTVPKKRVEDFLNPQLGLTARVSALLDLTLSEIDMRRIKVNDVLQAIKWRNGIIHKTGRLPKGLDQETIERNIVSVLSLSNFLARKKHNIEASPAMRELGETISSKHNVPQPSIWKIGRHNVLVRFEFLTIDYHPSESELEAIAKDFETLLAKLDNRFDPIEHLYIKYLAFPKETRARWLKGQLKVMHNTLWPKEFYLASPTPPA